MDLKLSNESFFEVDGVPKFFETKNHAGWSKVIHGMADGTFDPVEYKQDTPNFKSLGREKALKRSNQARFNDPVAHTRQHYENYYRCDL